MEFLWKNSYAWRWYNNIIICLWEIDNEVVEVIEVAQVTDVLQVLGLSRPGNCVHQILKWHAIMDLTSVHCQDQLNL